MVDCMTWRIVLRPGAGATEDGLPPAVVTLAPQFRHESMPDEVGLLLPTGEGPKRLIDAAAADPALCGDAILGLFLASPFLGAGVDGPGLLRAGVRWIANLPSVAQQDEEFSQQLTDVGLDLGRELACLAQFRSQGFKTAVVVTDAAGAAAAAGIAPEAMIVLPRVADFAAGFPSFRQRGTAAQAVADAARAAGWSGLILGLADAGEAEHETLWPEPLDGVVCRPVPA